MDLKDYQVASNGISLGVSEIGDGPAVLFCQRFPNTSYTWRRQMQGVASRLSSHRPEYARLWTQFSTIIFSFVHAAAHRR
jgi:hypothetical protein